MLPGLEEFGLVGMQTAAQTEDERWFSLPKVMLNRLPRIELKKQFSDSSTPLIDGPLMPFIVDGWFDFRLFAIWAKRGATRLEAVNGVGDPAITPLCLAALDCLGEYRAFACKRFYGVLREFAQFNGPDLYFAYLPCLGLLSLKLVNLSFNHCLSTRVRESSDVLKSDRDAVGLELDKMAGLTAIIIHENQSHFVPDERVGSVSAIQIKAWSSSLLRMAKVFSPQDATSAVAANVGAARLLDAAKSLNGAVAHSLRKIRRTKDSVPPPVAVDPDVETEPGPEFIEVGDEPEVTSYEAPENGNRSLYRVVDINALKADPALAKLCRENWQTAKLLRLSRAMPALDLDPEKFEHLARENPHAAAPLLAVARSLRLFSQFGRQPLTCKPLLLVGASGTGKSFVARQIASMCSNSTPYQYLSLAGMSDSREIIGTPRGWSTCSPSLPVKALGEGVANPFVILDEIEKAGTSSHNGSALAALLPALEPSTAKNWYDSFLSCQIDASMINYIATANTLTGLSAPLLSRFQIYHLRAPKPEHFPKIIASVIREFSVELGVHPALLPQLDGEDIAFLTESCEGNIRLLSQTVRRILEHRAAEAHQGVLH